MSAVPDVTVKGRLATPLARLREPVRSTASTQRLGQPPLFAALGAFLALVLIGTHLVSPRLPGLEQFRGLAGGGALDYARTPGSIPPLTAEFVAAVFGDRSEPLHLATRDVRSLSVPGGSVPSTAAPAPGGRTVVQHPLTNDDLEDAYPVKTIPFTATTNSSGASRQSGEPAAGCAPVGGTIWYRYRPGADQGLVANTFGTSRAVSLSVFTDRGGDLAEIRCHSDVDGNAQVTFPAQEDVDYYFQLASPAGGGAVVFNLDPLGTTERVSVDPSGEQANGKTWVMDMTPDGRFVVLTSAASNLVKYDRNDLWDVFVHDRVTRKTELVSVSTDGKAGDGHSGIRGGSISADGRFVVFSSRAENLVDGDDNLWPDVFVHDRLAQKTTRVSVSSDGQQGRAPIDPLQIAINPTCDLLSQFCAPNREVPSISANGRYVAFASDLVGLVSHDVEPEPGWKGWDLFVHDRETGETSLVSVASDGTNGNDESQFPSMSADGRYVAFRSAATNLVGDEDRNGVADIFVHDRRTATTERVSVSSRGREGDGDSLVPSISADGRYVAFTSSASTLVDGDENSFNDVFVHDRRTRETIRVSVSSQGEEQDVGSDPTSQAHLDFPHPSISADGRYIAFHSPAANLASEDDDTSTIHAYGADVFVHDRRTGNTIIASVSSAGRQGEVALSGLEVQSTNPVISADGRIVAFSSYDPKLVEDDTNGSPHDYLPLLGGVDAFVHAFRVLR